MSVFNPDETPAVFFDELVGEGKKFKDQESLAKGKWESDRVIAERENELKELREELAARDKIEDLLSRVKPPESAPSTTPSAEAHQPAKPAVDQDELAEMIRKTLDAEKVNTRVAENVNTVSAKLVELFGDEAKASQVVKERARELGVSVEFLQSTAAQSPKAFFDLVGVKDQATSVGPTKSDVNPQAFGNRTSAAKPGTYAFYEEMRKTNPVQWQKMQPQIHKEALEKGEAFFD